MQNRRHFLSSAALTAAAAAIPPIKAAAAEAMLPFANGRRALVQYPQKRPLLQLTARPPQLETPFEVFDQGAITPNDAFFVRYHLANLPLNLDPARFTLEIKGHVRAPRRFSLAELKQLDPVEIVAVNQCSGNSRGFFEPRVGGGQLGHGAMGNATWRGVPLRRLLDLAGVQAGARQVVFNGLDMAVVDTTPDFVKALEMDHARDGEVMVAYAMNGEDLPVLNGFPLRLVVPGHFGTYWIKHLHEITVTDRVFDGYWMQTAYRIPANDCACVPPGSAPQATVPIARFAVRSFITNLRDGQAVAAGRDVLVKGIAFDAGSGIRQVDVSGDGGRSWRAARLGQDLGKYSFREWQLVLQLPAGLQDLKVRATANSGETQPEAARWNPAGYLRNVVETVRVNAA